MRLSIIIAALCALLVATNVAAYDWPQFNGGPEHTGSNSKESVLTPATVAQLQLLFQVTLPDVADGAPAVLQNVATGRGVIDLVFVTTRDGHLLALDAHAGAVVWSVQHGAGTCLINESALPCYTTSSPAVDPNRQFVYSYGLDGFVHKHRVGDGEEVIGGGWPELVTTKPQHEKGSSAVSIATASDGTSYLYVAQSGYPGDAGDYQGHLTTVNLATGEQHVYNTVCSTQAVHFVDAPGSPDCAETNGAIWGRPGVIYDPRTNKIYLTTGNATFDGVQHWGDSVLALSPDGRGQPSSLPLDSYTPVNQADLDGADDDLGSTEPALVPTLPGSTVAHLAVQGGKDSLLRLLNLDNLSGQGGPGHLGGEVGQPVAVPQGSEILCAPAVWINPSDGTTWVFVTTTAGISGIRIVVGAGGVPILQPVWQHGGDSEGSALVAAGVLYYAVGDRVVGYNPVNGAVLGQSLAVLGGFHWESPVVANGILYISDEANHLTAFAPPSVPLPSPAPPPRSVPPSAAPPVVIPPPRIDGGAALPATPNPLPARAGQGKSTSQPNPLPVPRR